MAKFTPSRVAWFTEATMLPTLSRGAILTGHEALAQPRQSDGAAG